MKDLAYYLSLPYTVILRPDDDGDVVARVEELPGCAAHGSSETGALENLLEAKELWITDCLERGDPVPEPSPVEQLPSGKWLQRVPRTLHKRLAAMARSEAVSLNQLVTSILSEAIGRQIAGTPEMSSGTTRTTFQVEGNYLAVPREELIVSSSAAVPRAPTKRAYS